jgi:acyl-coenzyme A thioesterase PaaI-like protein
MPGFDIATAVRLTAPLGCYEATVDHDWQAGGRTNGGYLLALLGRAALETVRAAAPGAAADHPVAASAHFVRPAVTGSAEIEVAVLHAGRKSVATRARLRQRGEACVEALITFGSLDGEMWWDAVPVPELPAEDTCIRLPVDGPGFAGPLLRVLDERLDPTGLGWLSGRPSGRGELRGWVRFADRRPLDPLGLLAVVDCLPPATFDLGILGWMPTVELTCHVRAMPRPGPLVARRRVRHVSGERVDEVCDVWDSSGRLVATGHQLAGIRVPEAA